MISEIIGMAATLFVVASFLFKDETQIRIVNIIGAVLFVLYGLSIGAVSVWVSNLSLICIHLYFVCENHKNTIDK